MQPLASSTSAGDDISWDWVMLLPALEAAGVASYAAGATALPTDGVLQLSWRGVQTTNSFGVVGTPGSYVGDYLLVPPSGAEGRTTRIIVKASRGQIINNLTPNVSWADAGIDDISARLYVTPRYLT
jgi:hypothetical protein